MEFFVIIVICKIVFCRLMILYTQYSPKSVFHLQTSEMVLFVTITITNNCWLFLLDNDVVRTICSYEFLDFYDSSLLNPSRSRWFQVVPARSWCFQLVPGGSSSFLILVCSFVFPFDHFYILVLQQIVESRAQFATLIPWSVKIIFIFFNFLKKF